MNSDAAAADEDELPTEQASESSDEWVLDHCEVAIPDKMERFSIAHLSQQLTQDSRAHLYRPRCIYERERSADSQVRQAELAVKNPVGSRPKRSVPSV